MTDPRPTARPRPIDPSPLRPCPGCGGDQRLRKTCRGGKTWVCQEPACRRKDVVVPGNCRG